jgi:hypothetical protein
LRQVSGTSELKHVNIVENFVTVKPTEDEDSAISKQSGMIAPSGWWPTSNSAFLV